VKSGVGVITPNVFSSGSAKWNIMAAYGAEINQGKSASQANAYISKLLHNTVAQPSSASAALQTFLSGQGDVLLDYEDDALYAKSKGEAVDIITPPQTILIENPIAVTKTAGSSAKAFVSYLLSPAGQKVWGQQGYRPVLPSVASQFHFPKPKTLFTIDSLGGWTSVNSKFFDPQTGIVAHVEQSLGVSTASG
jgi:sulfate transport system substrate-binding protein